jgi:hypothetical protein
MGVGLDLLVDHETQLGRGRSRNRNGSSSRDWKEVYEGESGELVCAIVLDGEDSGEDNGEDDREAKTDEVFCAIAIGRPAVDDVVVVT